MGLRATLRQVNVSNDAFDVASALHDPIPGYNAGGPTSSNRILEKLSGSRRKVDSVLDDIMGDPEDFRDLADSDGESGGRWEDAVRAALEHEEAGVGASHQEIRESEDEYFKASHDNSTKKSEEIVDDSDKGLSNGLRISEDGGSSRQNGKGRHHEVHETHGHKHSSSVPPAISASKQGKTHHTRYYIIKSLNHHNIAKSIEKGIWATQAMNEPVLNEAFETSERVRLVFSVNMSGHFQGYAQMTSPIGRRRANVWSEANEGANPWGGTFSVDWLRLHDLPFQKTVHLKNPLNSFKPVKISRDCQELTQEIGEALCTLIDEGADREGRPKRKVVPADLIAHMSKRHCLESPTIMPDGPFKQQMVAVPPGGGPHFPGTYPQFSRGHGHDLFSSHGPVNRLPEGFPSQASQTLEGGRVSKSKSPHPTSSGRNVDWDRDHDRGNRHRDRERGVERERSRDGTRSSSSGRSGDSPMDEDLLNMTYEEYLQRHGHMKDYNGNSQGSRPYYNSPGPGLGGAWMGKNSRLGAPDDQYSNYITNWYNRQGPTVARDGMYGRGVGNTYPGMGPTDGHWLGKVGDARARRPSRAVDGKPGGSFHEQNGRPSKCIESIVEAGS